jgi:hypothetical protein
MAFIRHDRVANTATTTGTGDFTLSGSSITAHRTLQSVAAVSDTLSYAIAAVDGTGAETGEWETGIGTYSATNTLTRTTVLASSNGGSLVNFSAGTKRVYLTALANDINATVRSGSGAPSGVSTTGLYARTDAPFQGVIYNNGSALANSYTWAGRPTANSTHAGLVITITDIGGHGGAEFVCVTYDGGTNYAWVPVSKYVKAVNNHTFVAPIVGNGAYQTAATDTLPAGLVIPGCRLIFEHMYSFTGVTATKTPSARINGTTIHNIGTTSATHLSYKGRAEVMVSATDRNSQFLVAPSLTISATLQGNATAHFEAAVHDLTNAATITWGCTATTPDTFALLMRKLAIEYP